MQKTHLYEAIFLVNRGVDEAVRGLERLKRAKGSQLDAACFEEELVLFEDHREGKSPEVWFFTPEEQRDWQRQYSNPTSDAPRAEVEAKR